MIEPPSRVRIDKWLWAARFFKSRSLAQKAVTSGRVKCNGERVKPARTIRLGDHVRVRRGDEEMIVVVKLVTEQRRGAPEAQRLYAETAESVAGRERQKGRRRAERELIGAQRVDSRFLDRKAIRRLKERQRNGRE